MMKPIFCSVDLEFTDGNVTHGQVMSMGLAFEDGTTMSRHFPVTTKASISPWVRTNQDGLLMAALKMGLSHHSWRDRARYRLEGAVGTLQKALIEKMFETMDTIPRDELIPHEDGGHNVYDNTALVMVTYCGGYDFAFVDKLFTVCGLKNPFHYEMVDISALAMGKFGLPWGFSQDELEGLLSMKPNPDPHDPVADAKHQLEMFQRITGNRK